MIFHINRLMCYIVLPWKLQEIDSRTPHGCQNPRWLSPLYIMASYLLITYMCGWVPSHFNCVPLCTNLLDCRPPGSPVHGILQARIPEWVAMPSSRGSSRRIQGLNLNHLQSTCAGKWVLYRYCHMGSPTTCIPPSIYLKSSLDYL